MLHQGFLHFQVHLQAAKNPLPMQRRERVWHEQSFIRGTPELFEMCVINAGENHILTRRTRLRTSIACLRLTFYVTVELPLDFSDQFINTAVLQFFPEQREYGADVEYTF